ncbi:hypothetical protein BDR07DRAFT_1437667, partial [Suillus spraguei]
MGIIVFVFNFANRVKGLSSTSAKWPILCGALMIMSALVLFAFADGPDKYWPKCVPILSLEPQHHIKLHSIAILRATFGGITKGDGSLSWRRSEGGVSDLTKE